jgi:hypothetical protein
MLLYGYCAALDIIYVRFMSYVQRSYGALAFICQHKYKNVKTTKHPFETTD